MNYNVIMDVMCNSNVFKSSLCSVRNYSFFHGGMVWPITNLRIICESASFYFVFCSEHIEIGFVMLPRWNLTKTEQVSSYKAMTC